MIKVEADVAVVGAGFSGSLIAMLLQRIGIKPVLIDRGSHPRFAVGESSTPVTNLILEDLARRYDLPRIAPLANYACWRQTYPEIVCGLKRGFSYFHHQFGQEFRPCPEHSNELLVAASVANEDADTHWLRADFDQFLCNEACRLGISYFEQTSINLLAETSSGWEMHGTTKSRFRESPLSNDISANEENSDSAENDISIAAKFVIDASGESCFLAKQLRIDPHPDGLRTRSRALFSHFSHVKKWSDLYASRGGNPMDHPYPCDDAALHHVFDGGWMWVLRFDNGITSAGFSLDPDRFPKNAAGNPESEWEAMLAKLPAVAEQFADAVPIVPWRQTDRMQRRLAQSSGPKWVMLPNTAAFLDPLHSTGNTFTIIGIERLLQIFEKNWGKPELTEELCRYDSLVQNEIEFLDLVVSGSFAGFREFGKMIAISMFYFSTAIWSEEERRAGRATRGGAFLNSDRKDLREALIKAVHAVQDANVSTAELTDQIRAAIAPFNRVGLCDPVRKNMYPYEI